MALKEPVYEALVLRNVAVDQRRPLSHEEVVVDLDVRPAGTSYLSRSTVARQVAHEGLPKCIDTLRLNGHWASVLRRDKLWPPSRAGCSPLGSPWRVNSRQVR